jgi:hypothetical protein
MRLCDKAGVSRKFTLRNHNFKWSHSIDREKVGSIYNFAWSPDGVQVAAVTASGTVLMAQIVDK